MHCKVLPPIQSDSCNNTIDIISDRTDNFLCDGSNCVRITGYRVCVADPVCCLCSEILAVLQALLLVCTRVMCAFV